MVEATVAADNDVVHTARHPAVGYPHSASPSFTVGTWKCDHFRTSADLCPRSTCQAFYRYNQFIHTTDGIPHSLGQIQMTHQVVQTRCLIR